MQLADIRSYAAQWTLGGLMFASGHIFLGGLRQAATIYLRTLLEDNMGWTRSYEKLGISVIARQPRTAWSKEHKQRLLAVQYTLR